MPEPEAPAPEPDCRDALPEPSHPCLDGCGNERGVGQPCTEDGGECARWLSEGGAFFCSADFGSDELQFCTLPCVEDGDCGTASVCIGDPDDPDSGRGCLPAACWDGPPTLTIEALPAGWDPEPRI